MKPEPLKGKILATEMFKPFVYVEDIRSAVELSMIEINDYEEKYGKVTAHVCIKILSKNFENVMKED